MISATLLGQSLLSGIFVGGLYGLLGLGLSLSWRFLRIINLAHFAFIILAAYLTYQMAGVWHLHPVLTVLLIVSLFFALGVVQQLVFTHFEVDEFASLLVTFGITIIIEALIQWIWTADFRRLETPHSTASFALGPLYVPTAEAAMFLIAVASTVVTWAWLRFTYLGKALRASAENPEIAAAFGVHHGRLALLLSGISAASAAVAGAFVALIFTLAPSQIFAWLGVVFAAVILGGLGNPLGVLLAGLLIGVSEAITMALTAPSWAPLVSFTLLILVLILRPNRV